MAWRGIHLSRPAYLSLDRQALKIDFKDDDGGTFRLPLEDLAYLIIDTPETALSSSVLAALAGAGTMVIGVDNRHLPSWSSLPWTSHYRQGDVIKLQTDASLPLKKRLWGRIVQQKIQAQARCLQTNSLDGADNLNAITTQVRSGDPDNVEARAARLYWSHLFPHRDFRRHDEDLPNALLNYGYAILRAAISRQLCASGFIPQLGLHHNSLSNAFNLADDLIEPYRPLVDHFAILALESIRGVLEYFTTEHRRAMTSIMEAELDFEGDCYLPLPAIERTVNSLRLAMERSDPSLLEFPIYQATL